MNCPLWSSEVLGSISIAMVHLLPDSNHRNSALIEVLSCLRVDSGMVSSMVSRRTTEHSQGASFCCLFLAKPSLPFSILSTLSSTTRPENLYRLYSYHSSTSRYKKSSRASLRFGPLPVESPTDSVVWNLAQKRSAYDFAIILQPIQS